MILSKNNNKKIETDHSQEKQTWGSKGERGGSGMEGYFEGFLDTNCCIWNGRAMGPCCTAQGHVCDWVTLLYNRTWRNTVNHLHFNNNNNLKWKKFKKEKQHLLPKTANLQVLETPKEKRRKGQTLSEPPGLAGRPWLLSSLKRRPTSALPDWLLPPFFFFFFFFFVLFTFFGSAPFIWEVA